MYTTVIKVNSYPPQYMTVGNETMRRAASGAFVTIYNTDPFERRSTPWIWDGINLKTEYGVNLVSYSVGTPVPMIKRSSRTTGRDAGPERQSDLYFPPGQRPFPCPKQSLREMASFAVKTAETVQWNGNQDVLQYGP